MSGKYAKKKTTSKHPLIPAWIFVPVMVLYNELLVHLWTAEFLMVGRLLTVALFALAFGGALGFLVSLLPAKAQKWTALGLAVLVSVISLMEYFLHDAYQNFMPFVTIFAGAGGVMTDYLQMILSLLVRNLWRIGLVLLPIVLYAIFAKCRKENWKTRGILALVAVVLYALSFGAVYLIGLDDDQLGDNYEFDSAVNAFGLNMAMIQDLFYRSGAVEQELEFQVMEPETFPTAPNATQSVSSDAEEEAQEEVEATEPIVYGENVLDLDFATLAAETKNSNIASLHSYVASQKPASQNAYTGMFEGKNLILITAEAFTTEVIDPEMTPTLYRLANEGIRFTDYYQPAWGASTTAGEYSNVVGLVPANGGGCMDETFQQDLFLTIGNQLQALGYTSTAYHNHQYDFYERHKTHTGLGYDQFIAMGTGMQITNEWPESDLEMMEFTVEQYIDQQPFNIYYMSVSGHSVYGLSGHAQARKNYDKVADMDCSEPIKCYFAAQLEFEYAMKYLVEQLEAAGIADETVIVIATDHYPYGLEKSSTYANSKNYLAELYGVDKVNFLTRDSNSLIIWSGCLEDQDIVVDTPVYSLDILPTLSNLFGVSYDSRLLVGRDVFSDADPLVLWPNGSWKTTMGVYDASKKQFTPAEGVEVDDGYVSYISSIVSNKTKFSKSVANFNYYNEVVNLLESADA